jgi:hypothetical protein
MATGPGLLAETEVEFEVNWSMSALPIQALIEDRCHTLGLSCHDVVRRARYVNLSKGHRRLDELLGGNLHHTQGLIERLPVALDLPVSTVTEAVEATERELWAREDAAWRAGFVPHAIILTEHERPTSITFAAFTAADRHLIVNFEPDSSRISYVAQALKAVRLRSPIRFYGNAVGVVVNYGPDTAVRFDLDGTPPGNSHGSVSTGSVDGVDQGAAGFTGSIGRHSRDLIHVQSPLNQSPK